MSNHSPDEVIELHLNLYQAANLHAVLADINERCFHYNNGDWVNEVRFKLEEYDFGPYEPNHIVKHERNALGQPL